MKIPNGPRVIDTQPFRVPKPLRPPYLDGGTGVADSGPATANGILLESPAGSYLLLESGDFLLTE